jgi:hypothetical protein
MIISLTHEHKYTLIVQLELSEREITEIQNMYHPESINVSKNTTLIKVNVNSRRVRPLISYLTYKEFLTRGKKRSSNEHKISDSPTVEMRGSDNPPDFIGDYIRNH